MTVTPRTETRTCPLDALDSDHHALLECLTTLNVTTAGGDRDAICRRLEWLAAHVEDHFEREEAVMEHARYQYAAAHLEEHRSFRRLIQAIRRLYADRPDDVDLRKTADILKVSIENHVLRSDAILHAYLQGCGPVTCLVPTGDRAALADRRSDPGLVAVMVRVPPDQVDVIRGCGRLLRLGGAEAENLTTLADPLGTMSLEDAVAIAAGALR